MMNAKNDAAAPAVLWRAAEAALATQGQAVGDWAATGVSIDTRSLRPGDLFVALQDVRDGHDFVANALAKGAAAALVSRRPDGVGEDAPLLIVPDVLKALEDLGRVSRARSRAKVVAVTGSVGKTSTKEMLRVILGDQGTVHAAEASYNNHWGVPLTLARMPADCDYAVIEIGMSNPGEIEPLAVLARPDVAMITIVAPAHLASFPSVEAIAVEKGAIFKGLVPGGVAVINGDMPTTPMLCEMALAAGAKVVRFGAGAGEWQIDEIRVNEDTTVVRAHVGAQALLFKLGGSGRHFAQNALGALASAQALGADLTLAALALAGWAPPAGRGQRERIVLDMIEETFFDLFDDAFNANPASMAAALDVLIAAQPVNDVGRVGNGRRIAILGDMLELGPQEEVLHREISEHPGLEGVHQIHCVGLRMRALYDALSRKQRGIWVETAPELAAQVRGLVDAGDVLLVKGSKSSKVSLVVEALKKMGQYGSQTEGNV